MKITKNLFYGMIAIVFLVTTTNCSAPPNTNNELLDAKMQLERDLAMYEDTWNRFLKGDTAVVNEERFQKDVVVVTAEGDIVGIEATKNYYMNYMTGFSNIEFTILEVIGQGDRLVKHWNFKGTHTGEFFGIRQSGFLKYKIADMVTDGPILRKARQAAFKLVKEDPNLNQPEHQLIRERFINEYQDKLEQVNIS